MVKTSSVGLMLLIVGLFVSRQRRGWLIFKTLTILFGSCMALAMLLFFVFPQRLAEASDTVIDGVVVLTPIGIIVLDKLIILLAIHFANVHEMNEDQQLFASHHVVVFMKALKYSIFIFTFDEERKGVYILNLTFATISEVMSRCRLWQYGALAVKRHLQRQYNHEVSQGLVERNPFLRLHAGSRCLVSHLPLIVLLMFRWTNWIPTASRSNHINRYSEIDISLILPTWVYLAFFLSETFADILSLLIARKTGWEDMKIGEHHFGYGLASLFFNYAIVCHIFTGAASSFETFPFRKYL